MPGSTPPATSLAAESSHYTATRACGEAHDGGKWRSRDYDVNRPQAGGYTINCASGEARDGGKWRSRDYGWSRLIRGDATLQGRFGWRFWKARSRQRAFVNWQRPVSISSARPGRKGTDKPDRRQAVDRDRSNRASGRRECNRRWERFV